MANLLVVQHGDQGEMFEEILRSAGHTTRRAETAAEAVKAIQAERPEVVTINLGIDGGVEPVFAALQGEPPVPVLIASGARDVAERADALGLPYLAKPFTSEDLLQAVGRLASRS